MAAAAPVMLAVRVARKGFARILHPTLEQLEDCVGRAIADMHTGNGVLRFRSPEKLQDFICSRVRAELSVTIGAEFDADEVDSDDMPTGATLLKIWTERVGPVYVLMDPVPIQPQPPLARVGIVAQNKTPAGKGGGL